MLLNQLYIDVQINVPCYLSELEEIINMYLHKLNYKFRRVRWKSKVFVRNQVIKYRLKMIKLYNIVIVLDIVMTN